MQHEPIAGLYRHYKGNTYEVIAVATHSETQEKLVVYKALHQSKKAELWVRSLNMFMEHVHVNGKKQARFEYMHPPAA